MGGVQESKPVFGFVCMEERCDSRSFSDRKDSPLSIWSWRKGWGDVRGRLRVRLAAINALLGSEGLLICALDGADCCLPTGTKGSIEWVS